MDGLKIITIMLGIANFTCWFIGGPENIPEKPEDLKGKISNIECEIEPLEKLASWTERAERALAKPPSENPNTILNRLRAIAEDGGCQINEAGNQSGNPPRIIIGGNGKYQSIAAFLMELDREKAARIERISLETRDDRFIEVKVEAVVRSGPWEGQAQDGIKAEPWNEAVILTVIGKTDLFGLASNRIPEKITPRPVIKYLGYFEKSGSPTVILEENGKGIVLKVGGSLPSGCRILNATIQQIEVSGRGATWSIPIEKRH